MTTRCEALRQLTQKLLMQRDLRSATCRVFAPGGSTRTYTIIVECDGVREQFFVQAAHVEQFAVYGNDQSVIPELRAGVRTVERLVTKKRTARNR